MLINSEILHKNTDGHKMNENEILENLLCLLIKVSV